MKIRNDNNNVVNLHLDKIIYSYKENLFAKTVF